MTSRDFHSEAIREAQAEDAKSSAIKQWIASRIDAIHRTITAHDVLRRNGVELQYSENKEQFSCPFHGRDTKPSARVYPESTRGPSSAWCFVCQEYWDAIRLWRKFNNFTGKFTALLREIETAYNISVPESPLQHYAEYEAPEDYALDEVKDLLLICDRRLLHAKPVFDFEGFSKISVALDRLRGQVTSRQIPLDHARNVLGLILDKIGARERI